MNRLLLCILAFGISYTTKAQCTSLTYNGKTYKTVQIGTQCWMAENLNDDSHTAGNSSSVYGVSCFDSKYGRLYDWEAAKNMAHKIPGWHLPTVREWSDLATALGGSTVAGTKLKEGGSSGFEGLLAGGDFYYFGSHGYFWSATPSGSSSAWCRRLSKGDANLDDYNSHVNDQRSVRLLKD